MSIDDFNSLNSIKLNRTDPTDFYRKMNTQIPLQITAI